MPDFSIFNAGPIVLQSGLTLRDTKIVYKTHGQLNTKKDNAILFATRFYGTHRDNEYLIGPGRALDTNRYFIMVPDLIGNGLSSSPSNTPPPFDRARFPDVTILDNVRLQRRLLLEVFGVERLALALGWSMGAQQAFQWAAIYPSDVERLIAIAGSARTSPHNFVFLEGMKAALTADVDWRGGWYINPPQRGLRAMARCWAGWALSQAYYRQQCYKDWGYSSLEDFLVGFWEGLFLNRDANNMLCQIWTWQHCDLSANEIYFGDFELAMGAIRAKTIVMPGATDLYFPSEDSAIEVSLIKQAELRPIPSIWGHYAGGAANPLDVAFVEQAIRELLST